MPDACPDCRALLVTDLSEIPWCPACRWNLATLEPGDGRPGLLARLDHRIAYRDSLATFERLRTSGGTPPASRSRWLLTLISALLLTATLALAGLGVWLCVRDFPSWWALPGLLCLAVAWYMRPRSHGVDAAAHLVEKQDAPTLHGLVERVANAAGTPLPHIIMVDAEYNASAGIAGLLRRRRVLTLGTPDWIGLSPQERVATLAHELGHFANGDPRRSLTSQPAVTVFSALASLTEPMFRPGVYPTMTDRIAYGLLIPVHKLMVMAHLGTMAVALREAQRAEYRADAIAARIAGRDATVRMLDLLVHRDSLVTVTASKARAQDFTPQGVRAAVAETMTRQAPRAAEHRQHTLRTETRLLQTHPPTGLRAQLVAEMPIGAAEVTCSEAESARIDGELAGLYGKTRRDVAHLD